MTFLFIIKELPAAFKRQFRLLLEAIIPSRFWFLISTFQRCEICKRKMVQHSTWKLPDRTVWYCNGK